MALLALVGLAGCGERTGTVCTESFASSGVFVVDSLGAPAATAIVTSVLVRTGDTLPITTLIDHVPGAYTIIDDGSVHLIRTTGDSIRVRAVQGAAAAEAIFVFDAPGGCHINRVSGPDTLTLR
jgi:hypothetical protein